MDDDLPEPLDLVPTEDLIVALKRRFDEFVLITYAEPTDDGRQLGFFYSSFFPAQGLAAEFIKFNSQDMGNLSTAFGDEESA